MSFATFSSQGKPRARQHLDKKHGTRSANRPLFLTLARNNETPFLQVSPALTEDTSSNCSTSASHIPVSPFSPLEFPKDGELNLHHHHHSRYFPKSSRSPFLDVCVGDDSDASSTPEEDEDDESQYIFLPPSSEYHVPCLARGTFTMTPLLASPLFPTFDASLTSHSHSRTLQPSPRILVDDKPLASPGFMFGHWESMMDERLHEEHLDVPEDVGVYAPSRKRDRRDVWSRPSLHSQQGH